MKSEDFKLIKYEADEGKVFDWKDLTNHITVNDDGKEVVNHLYAKTLFIGQYDNINNYVEVEEEKL